MRKTFLFILATLAIPAFAAQSWEGVWSGTTTQGKTIVLTVNSSNRFSQIKFGAIGQATFCSTEFDMTVNYPSGGPTVNASGNFTVTINATPPNGAGFSLNGALTTAGTGSGSATFNTLGSAPIGCTTSGSTSWSVTRQGGPPLPPPPTSSTVAILPVVGSVQGVALFRTGVQIHNPRTTPISGRFVYHAQGVPGSASDPSMSYTLQGGQTLDYADLLPAMGLSGLGSIDVVTDGDPAPITVARVYSDAGEAGTAGFTIDLVAPSQALQSGDNGVIIVPSDLTKTRLNVGLRSLDGGVSILITLRDKNGVQKGTQAKSMAANQFEQQSVAALLPGLTVEGSDTITFSINSGKAIIYGASTENKTQDPSLQYAKKTF